jgi:DNA-binding GntR family transcriptional regulator
MSRPRKPRVGAEFDRARGLSRGLWEGVADSIRDAILSGAIPAGSSLVEADFASRFGVSRGPIRDALRELAREGLVVDLPRRGTVVSTLTFADLREVYAVREGLEIVALKWAIEREIASDMGPVLRFLQAMEAAWDRAAEYSESLAEDLAFHRALVALSGNGRIIDVYEQMLSQTQLLARTAALSNPRLTLGMRTSAHRDIVDSVLSRDAERARLAVAEHYLYAEGRLFDLLAQDARIVEEAKTILDATAEPEGAKAPSM